nr:hypothetical protein [Tanacetum cinerariifolium]
GFGSACGALELARVLVVPDFLPSPEP